MLLTELLPGTSPRGTQAIRRTLLAFLLWSARLSGPCCVEAVVEGYRDHVELGPAELDRLELSWTGSNPPRPPAS